MKIGLVLSSTPAYSETFFNSKIKGLQSQGFEVVLFVQQDASKYQLCVVKKAYKIHKNPVLQGLASIVVFVKLLPNIKKVIIFIQLEKLQGTSFTQILKKIYLNAHILKEKVDWLHFGFATMALGKEHLANSMEAKMAVSFRGFDIAIYPMKHPNCYDLLWQQVNKVHTISDDLLNKAYEFGLSRTIPAQKITPAIDTTFFIYNRKLINTEKKLQFLTVARLHWKKGLLLTLDALAKLKEKNIEFSYTIVGEGDEYERIAFAILELGLKDNVFLVGKKNREDVFQLYKESTIYIQYSISEGFCNAVLEAQAMGLLCVVSDAEGLAENVNDQKTGWVVPKNNVFQLVTKLEEVVHLPDAEKRSIISKAQKRIKAEFNVEKQQLEFKQFYC